MSCLRDAEQGLACFRDNHAGIVSHSPSCFISFNKPSEHMLAVPFHWGCLSQPAIPGSRAPAPDFKIVLCFASLMSFYHVHVALLSKCKFCLLAAPQFIRRQETYFRVPAALAFCPVTSPLSAECKDWGKHLYFFLTFCHGSLNRQQQIFWALGSFL